LQSSIFWNGSGFPPGCNGFIEVETTKQDALVTRRRDEEALRARGIIHAALSLIHSGFVVEAELRRPRLTPSLDFRSRRGLLSPVRGSADGRDKR
jgi:hypothetical protein